MCNPYPCDPLNPTGNRSHRPALWFKTGGRTPLGGRPIGGRTPPRAALRTNHNPRRPEEGRRNPRARAGAVQAGWRRCAAREIRAGNDKEMEKVDSLLGTEINRGASFVLH